MVGEPVPHNNGSTLNWGGEVRGEKVGLQARWRSLYHLTMVIPSTPGGFASTDHPGQLHAWC